MEKTFAEKRFFEWHEDNVAVSLRAKSGSYLKERDYKYATDLIVGGGMK